MTAAHPPVPKIISEHRVAAELRTADDKLMTTQGSISYESDIVDQYFERRNEGPTNDLAPGSDVRLWG